MILGLPVFGRHAAAYRSAVGTDSSVITKDYISNSSLLINLAKGIGKLLVCYKEFQNLSGYTELVESIGTVIDDLNNNKFSYTQIMDAKTYAGGVV